MKLGQANSQDERAVVKGDGVERASDAAEDQQAVNIVDWARHFVADQVRQNRADAKAFTGKGKHHELRLLLAEIDDVEQYMHDLVTASRAMAGRVMHLVVHANTASGLRSLRWRSRAGTMPHLSWAEAAEAVATLPVAVVDWYRTITQRSVEANERHKELRRAIALTRKVIARSEPHLYPRRVSKAV